MKKTVSFLFAFLFTLSLAFSQSAFFDKVDQFMYKNVIGQGLVTYEAIKANPAELNELVDMIGSYSLSGKSKSEAKAFWINAYNVICIKNVVNHYPIAKPLDVPGFFDKKTFKVAGSMLTLSDIENKKIRPTYKDARTHFALVCAARSCPPLMNFAYRPEKLDSQLNSVTKKALNDPVFMKVSSSAKTAQFSQIFEWYKEDFLAEAGSLVEYVNKYRTSPIPKDYKTSFYTYNWSLNVKK